MAQTSSLSFKAMLYHVFRSQYLNFLSTLSIEFSYSIALGEKSTANTRNALAKALQNHLFSSFFLIFKINDNFHEADCIYLFETRHLPLYQEGNRVKLKYNSAVHLTLTLTL